MVARCAVEDKLEFGKESSQVKAEVEARTWDYYEGNCRIDPSTMAVGISFLRCLINTDCTGETFDVE